MVILHLFDNVLEQEYIDSMKEDIIKGSIEKARGNWQSNPKIHTDHLDNNYSNDVLQNTGTD